MDPIPTSLPEVFLNSEGDDAEPGSPSRSWISQLSSAVRTATAERLDSHKLPEHTPQEKPEIFIDDFCLWGSHASVDNSAMLTASAVVPPFSPMSPNQVQQNPLHLNFLSPVCPPPYNSLTFGVHPGFTSFLCGPCAPQDSYTLNISEIRNQNVSPLSYPAPLGLNLSSSVLVPVNSPVHLWWSAELPLYHYHFQPEVRPNWCLCPHTVSVHQTFNPTLFSTPRNTKRCDRNARRLSNKKQGPPTAVEEKTPTHAVLKDDTRSKIQKSNIKDKIEVSEERKAAVIGNTSFMEYLEELCSNEDFVRKVEYILDTDYLNSLLSLDGETIHLSVLGRQQEMTLTAGQRPTLDPQTINSQPHPDHAGPDSAQKMGPNEGWGNASPLLPSHLPEETTDAPAEGHVTPLLSYEKYNSLDDICSFLWDNGDHFLSSLTQTDSCSYVLPLNLTSEAPEVCSSPSAGKGDAKQQKTTTAGEEMSSEQSPETEYDTILRQSLRLLCQNGKEKAENERVVLIKEKKKTKKRVKKSPEVTPKRDVTSHRQWRQSSGRRQLFRKVQSGWRSKSPEINTNPAEHSGEEQKSSVPAEKPLIFCKLMGVSERHLSETAGERREEDGSQTASAAERKTKNTVSDERKQPAGHHSRQDKRSKAPAQTDPEVNLQEPAREPQPVPPSRRNRRMKDKEKKSSKLTAATEEIGQIPQKCSPAETPTRSKKSAAARKGDQKGSADTTRERTKSHSEKKSKKSPGSSSILCPESSPAAQAQHCVTLETKSSEGLQAAGNSHNGSPKQIQGAPGLKSPLKRSRHRSSKDGDGGGREEQGASWEGKLGSSPTKKRKEDERKRLEKSRQDF